MILEYTENTTRRQVSRNPPMIISFNQSRSAENVNRNPIMLEILFKLDCDGSFENGEEVSFPRVVPGRTFVSWRMC